MDAPGILTDVARTLLESDALNNATKAAELLKTAADIKQQQANTAKLKSERKKVDQDLDESRHNIKELLTAVTPLFTTLILAGTLVFQMVQAQQAVKDKQREEQEKRQEVIRQAALAEQSRFTDAIKTIQTAEKISPAATLLNTFTAEPYKSQARQVAIKLLLRSSTTQDFQDMFSATIEPVTMSDLPVLLQIDRPITVAYATSMAGAFNPLTNQIYVSKMHKVQKDLFDLHIFELGLLSDKLSLLLKERPKADNSEVDLSGTSFTGSSLKGSNLRHAKLSGTTFTSVNLEGCDLGDVTDFDGSSFYLTAWWQAKQISPLFMEYLEKNAPYRKGVSYSSSHPVSADEFATDVARLKAQNLHRF